MTGRQKKEAQGAGKAVDRGKSVQTVRGGRTGANITGSRTQICRKIKNRNALGHTLGYLPPTCQNTNLKCYMQSQAYDIYRSEELKQRKCPSTEEWLKDVAYICMRWICTAITQRMEFGLKTVQKVRHLLGMQPTCVLSPAPHKALQTLLQ